MKKLLTLLKEAGISTPQPAGLSPKASRYPQLSMAAIRNAKKIFDKVVLDLEKSTKADPEDILKLNMHLITVMFNNIQDPQEAKELSKILVTIFNRIQTYTEAQMGTIKTSAGKINKGD